MTTEEYKELITIGRERAEGVDLDKECDNHTFDDEDDDSFFDDDSWDELISYEEKDDDENF